MEKIIENKADSKDDFEDELQGLARAFLRQIVVTM